MRGVKRVRRAARRCALPALAVAAAVFGAAASAQEYSIPEIAVDVEIRADGSVRISEDRTYVFDGAFSFANYRLPKTGFAKIRDIRVSERGAPLTNENSERTGTFLVEESSSAVNLRWFYAAADERRTFTVTYTLDGAVVTGPEWSEFFWRYVAAGRERATQRLVIAIRLPESVPADSLHAWGRGPLARMSVASVPGGYDVTAANVRASEFVEVRSVFPTAVFDPQAVAVTDADFSLEWARADEAARQAEQARRAERRAERAGFGRELALLAVLVGIGAFGFLYNQYGRRHAVDSGAAHGGLFAPGRIQPAAIGWLVAGRQTTGGHLMATLLDLARRGYFRITEQPPASGWFKSNDSTFTIESTDKEPAEDLLHWEISLLTFVRGRLGGRERDLKELFEQHSRPVAKWFAEWKRELKAYGMKQGWVDRQSYKGAFWNASVQVLMLLVALAAVPLAGPVALPAALVCGVLALLSAAIPRRTQEGERLFHRWKGYRRVLSEADEHTMRDRQLDMHFIYAVAFGVRKRGIEALFEKHADVAAVMPWIVLVNPGASSASLARTFTTLNATGTAAFGGATGATGVAGAGGASAGAAGGGASGGAG